MFDLLIYRKWNVIFNWDNWSSNIISNRIYGITWNISCPYLTRITRIENITHWRKFWQRFKVYEYTMYNNVSEISFLVLKSTIIDTFAWNSRVHINASLCLLITIFNAGLFQRKYTFWNVIHSNIIWYCSKNKL